MLNSATNILLFKWETLKSTLMLIKSTGQNWPNYEKVWRFFFSVYASSTRDKLTFQRTGDGGVHIWFKFIWVKQSNDVCWWEKKITLLEICKLMYYFLCIFIGLLFLEVPQWTFTPWDTVDFC